MSKLGRRNFLNPTGSDPRTNLAVTLAEKFSEQAASKIASLSEDEIGEHITEQRRIRRQTQRMTRMPARLAGLFFIGITTLSGILFQPVAGVYPYYLLLELMGWCTALYILLSRFSSRVVIHIYPGLHLAGSVQALGPLLMNYCTAANYPRYFRPIIGGRIHIQDQVSRSRSALLRLLPMVGPNTELELYSEERNALRNTLRDKDPELVCALLQALQYVGISQDLVTVNKLAERSWSARSFVEVREAAIICTKAIEMRLAGSVTSGSLLRASSPDNTGDTLVRSAAGISVTDAAELPRIAEITTTQDM